MQNATDFFKWCENKKIALIGAGISSLEIVDVLLKGKADLTILDERDENSIKANLNEFKKKNVKLICGKNHLNSLLEFDVAIRSPGVYYNLPEIQNAIKKGIHVTSEIELFFEFCPCKIIGISGSDGKTTTSTLIAKILKQEGLTVFLGGNIGKTMLSRIEEIKPTDFAVVELSSFQLISMKKSPDIAILTNISPNHLNVHRTMEEYVNSKLNLISHQTSNSTAILNLDNAIANSFEKHAKGIVKKFSVKKRVDFGAYFDSETNEITYANSKKLTKILNVKNFKLKGIHNIENLLAAISAVVDFVSINSIKKVAFEFEGVEHRIEFVKKINEVDWFNDSIATSPTRTIAAIKSFNNEIILIAGGSDKNCSFEEFSDVAISKVKNLILTGANSKKIESALKNNKKFNSSNLKIHLVKNLKEAVELSNSIAVKNDVVLLSPASASFDSYENYKARGKHFKQLVQELEKWKIKN